MASEHEQWAGAWRKINSRAKGARGELELCRYLESLGFGPCYRTAQVDGKLSSDVICEALPGLHIECKRVEGMKEGNRLWQRAVEQARRDSAARSMPWALFFRQNREPWQMTIPKLMTAPSPSEQGAPPLTLRGERFIAAQLEGLRQAA